MGTHLSSMDDEIGKALAAKDPTEITNCKRESILSIQNESVVIETNQTEKTETEKDAKEKCENTDKSTVPCMRDKIDNLIEGYLLSGEFDVNAKSSKLKNLNPKLLLELDEKEREDKMAKKDSNQHDIISGDFKEDKVLEENRVDNSVHNDSKGDSSFDVNDKGDNSVEREGNTFNKICEKIEKGRMADNEIESNKKYQEEGIKEFLNSGKIVTELKQDTSKQDDQHSVERNFVGEKSDNGIGDEFVPTIPSQNGNGDECVPTVPSPKKSTTTFQTLIDRVLDSSLNSRSPPLEKTNILDAYDKSMFKTSRKNSPGSESVIEEKVDLSPADKQISKVNNVKKPPCGNDDMSLSKTKVVCLKDHIEKVLEKSFHMHMVRRNSVSGEQNRNVLDEQTSSKQEDQLVSGQNSEDTKSVNGQDKTFSAQELVETMIDQSKVINRLLLPSTTAESSVTGESTLASLERTASMSFEKYPIHCPSEVAKNDDYMLKFDKKTDVSDKLGNSNKSSGSSPNSQLSHSVFSQKMNYTSEPHPGTDMRYSQNPSSSSKSPFQQQSSPGLYEQKKMQHSNNQSSPKMYTSSMYKNMPSARQDQQDNTNKNPYSVATGNHGNQLVHLPSARQNQQDNTNKHPYSVVAGNQLVHLPSARQDQQDNINKYPYSVVTGNHGNQLVHPVPINISPQTRAVAVNNVGLDSSTLKTFDHGATNKHFGHPSVTNAQNDHVGNASMGNDKFMTSRHPIDSTNNVRHFKDSPMTSRGHVGSRSGDHQELARVSGHDQTIPLRDCSCISCKANPHQKSHHHHHQHHQLHHQQQNNGRQIAYSGQDNGRQQLVSMSPQQLNVREHLDGRHVGEKEMSAIPAVSSAMALGPSPPHQYFQQNRLQQHPLQNQCKRPQLIPSSPPISSYREYSGRGTQMQGGSYNNVQKDVRSSMSGGVVLGQAAPVAKQHIASAVNKVVNPEMLKRRSPFMDQSIERHSVYSNQRIQHHQQPQHQEGSWNKMRDGFHKDVGKQVQTVVKPSGMESVLDLSVKKEQHSPKALSVDQPLDLTCKTTPPSFGGATTPPSFSGTNTPPSFGGIKRQRFNSDNVSQQTKTFSNIGPTHIHHLETSVDKFCQNVRPLEEHFHRNDKLSAHFQHQVSAADHTSPKHVYSPQYGVVDSHHGQPEPKMVPPHVAANPDSSRTMPPPLMMVAGYAPPSSKSGSYLPLAHSQSKQQQTYTQNQQLRQYQQPVARQASPRNPSPRQLSPQLPQQQYQQTQHVKPQESPGANSESRNTSKRSNNVSKHEPIQNIIGIHSPNDILYLICRLCGQTYGSPYGFRKHFRNQHGFEPRAEHTIVQTISATKTALQTPPTLLYQGPPATSNTDDHKVSALSPPLQQSPVEVQSQDTSSNRSSESPDLESKNMMMVIKKAIDHSVSVAFKTENITQTSSVKRDQVNSELDSDAVSQSKSESSSDSEIKYLECHECRQTFQLNDFGSYKRHCRQHGQTKLQTPHNANDLIKKGDNVTEVKSTGGDMTEEIISTICTYCNIPFATVSFLKDHLNNVHPEEIKGKIESQRKGGCVLEGKTSENKDVAVAQVNTGNSVSSFSSSEKISLTVIPSSDVQIMPVDNMTVSASPDSSEQQNSEKEKEINTRPNSTGQVSCVAIKHCEDQDSVNSNDVRSPFSSSMLRQTSVESGSASENADVDRSADSDTDSIRYLHKKFKRRGSISVSSDVSNAKIPRPSENTPIRSPCSVKSPSVSSNLSNDSEVSSLQDGFVKKSEDNADVELEMPELRPGVDFTEVDESAQDTSRLILKFKCGMDGIHNKPEARHQLPFVWDRITRSQAGKNIKAPNYH